MSGRMVARVTCELGSDEWLVSGENNAQHPEVEVNNQLMEMVDKALQESPPEAYVLRRDGAPSLRTSSGLEVVPAYGGQNDSAVLLLEFLLPTIDLDGVTLRLNQDESASVRGRRRNAFIAADAAVRQRDTACQKLIDERRELKKLRVELAAKGKLREASETRMTDLKAILMIFRINVVTSMVPVPFSVEDSTACMYAYDGGHITERYTTNSRSVWDISGRKK